MPPQNQTNDTWNPVNDLRQKYPGLKDWSDDQVLDSLSDPAKFKSAFPQYASLGDDVIKHNIGKLKSQSMDFFADPGNQEGLYTMYGLTEPGKSQKVGVVQIPYSKVPAAQKFGYTWYQGSNEKYDKDKAAEGQNTNSWSSVVDKAKAKVNKALEPTPNASRAGLKWWQPTPGNPGTAPILSNTDKAAIRVVVGLPSYLKNLYHAAKDFQSGADQQTLVDLIDPAKMGQDLYNQFQTDWKSGDKQLAVQNLVGTLIGMAGVGMVTHGVQKVVGKGFEKVTGVGTPGGVAEAVRNAAVPKKAISDLVTQTEEAATKHSDVIRDAIEETRQREDLHSEEERQANVKAKDAQDKKNDEERERVNKENLKKLEEHGKAEVAAAKARREAVAKVADIKAQNDKALELEKQRQATEARHVKTSRVLYKKTVQTLKNARKAYNAAWAGWRSKMQGVTADMTPIRDSIKDQENSMTPEQVGIFRDILRNTAPDEEDMNSAQQDINSIAMQYFRKPYLDMHPDIQARVQELAKSMGIGDVTEAAVKEVPAERLHGWKSQLEQAIRMTKDGIVRNAIGKVLQHVRNLETQVSEQAGAGEELKAARAATGPYFDAFFFSPKELPPAAEKMVRETIPDYVRDKEQQERVNRIAAYDPAIASLQKHIATLDEELADIERRMRKVPHPKDLKPIPTPPDLPAAPQSPKLEKFQPKPFSPVETPRPDRVEHPDRPAPVGLEDARKIGEKAVLTKAEWFRRRAEWIATSAVIGSTMWNTIHGRLGEAAESVLVGMTTYYAIGKLADFIEKPEVMHWLTEPTDRTIQQMMKLPPAERTSVQNALRPAIEAAQAKGFKVSPALTAFVASGAGKNAVDREAVRREGVMRSPTRVTVKTPDGQTHIFPNAKAAADFKAHAGIQ